MAADGGGPPPFIKKEEELFDSISNSIADNRRNNDYRGITIAERRAAKCGFNASNVNAAVLSPPSYFTVPPGLSPSALLDSPVMLPNTEAQLSPTTGTFYPSPNHENLKLKLKIRSNSMETNCSAENNLMGDNNYKEAHAQEFEYPNELCLESRNEMMILDHAKPPPPPPPANHHHHQHQKNSAAATAASNPKMEVSKNSDDGFYWRKYGQKHVKGSEYPRSYYKCTNTNCPVTKKVERSHDGHIAEIVYKGSHNHPQPKQMMMATDANVSLSADHLAAVDDDLDHALDGTTTNSSSYLNDFPDTPAFFGEEAGDGGSESASLLEEADAESEAAKKRKRDGEVAPAVPRSTSREPKVVVQLESEVDILDDGYRWRKYGQKVVKGNPNPRSYYKCTTPNCPVRKHVERAANDIKSVITTYEGKHTHVVPSGSKGAGCSINSSETPGPAASPGKQLVQDIPLYLDRKPMQFNYTTSLPPAPRSGCGGELNYGASSLYQLPFPPFHSMPNYVPFKTYSKLYPDYMPMPIQMPMSMPMPMPMPMPSSPSSSSSSSSHLAPFHYGGNCQPSTQVKPKEEQDELCDTCLTIPNPPNGTM